VNCESHPEVDERTEAELAAHQVLLKRPARVERFVPAGPNKPPEWRLDQICERGAFFCPRCIVYKFASDLKNTVAHCEKCGRAMKWNHPIFNVESKKISPVQV
jgi:hypothetical protein